MLPEIGDIKSKLLILDSVFFTGDVPQNFLTLGKLDFMLVVFYYKI